ncbi:MAG: polysaccharide biosynthesis tyrosine autokinase [Ardenticatenaceae bacterium]|nr:polysaccharide biosynthesis tyrosine autokinase [Ardenticatenaceae bacterium]HBY96461.1 hypothetical protein [Chloroflexota bacterium]
MELKRHYINLVRRWIWLLLLAPLSASVTSYWVSNQQPTVYEAQARLVVGPGVDSPNPDLNALRTGGQLMQTYTKLVTTRPVLKSVIDDLNLPIASESLDQMITVKADSETQILTIRARDGDPDQAVAIANTLADKLVGLSPAGPNSAENELKVQLRSEVAKLQNFIDDTEARIKQLDTERQAAANAKPDPIAQSIIASTEARIKQLEAQLQTEPDVETQRLLLDQIALERNRLFDAQRVDQENQRLIIDQLSQERTRLTEAQRTLALLHTSLQNTFTNQVKIVEPAIAAVAVGSQLRLKVLLAGLSGLILALAIALIFEFVDDTLETVEDLAQAAGIPILSTIARYKVPRGAGREGLVVEALPESLAAEDYRMLGAKLRYSSDNRALRSVLISSSQTDDDTAETASNLAITLVQTGSRVVLVDANLRRPMLGKLFDLDNSRGLTDILTSRAKRPEVVPVSWAPGLSVLPSGSVSSNSFQLLASPRMVELVKQLESLADMVIIVAPPLLSFAGSLILASRVDGVIIVARGGKSRREALNSTVENLRSLGAHIVGTILHNSRQSGVPFVPSLPVPPVPTPNGQVASDEPLSRPLDDVEYLKGV